ncbi:MAG: NnrS family protein [Cereibacter changlensis]
MVNKPDYTGPTLFSYGFRPFFLGAALFALGVVPVWMLAYSGRLTLGGPFAPLDWHIHELLFGYTSAVLAGFLFTAVPNWTGRMPTRGLPLIVLVVLWCLGRLAVAGAFGLSPLMVLLIDAAFLAAVAAMVVAEIVAGKNWGNLKVVIPVGIYLAANVTFHLEAMLTGSSDIGRRLGFAVVAFLIMLIGGRIIPSFTRNWMVKQGVTPLPAPFGRFDGLCLIAAAVAMLLWTVWPEAVVSALCLVAAAVLHALRLSRWHGERTWPSPLLLMLHLAYLFLPLGLLATALAGLGLLPTATGMHLLGIGSTGGMTVAVMMRASLGHTGRALEAGRLLTTGFVCVALAALVRVVLPDAEIAGIGGLWIAAALWVAGFGLFVWRIGPVLLRPKLARRTANA